MERRIVLAVLAEREDIFPCNTVSGSVPRDVYHLTCMMRRYLLGTMQGGFIPDVVLYLSYYYTKTERA